LGIKDLFRAGVENLFGDERILSGGEKLGIKESFLGMKEAISGMNK
jgi:hypothetical protein